MSVWGTVFELERNKIIGNDPDSLRREIERLRLWIRRIENINDDPAHFSKEIDDACADAIAGKPMVGKITVYMAR
jgi:hypothetical protein